MLCPRVDLWVPTVASASSLAGLFDVVWLRCGSACGLVDPGLSRRFVTQDVESTTLKNNRRRALIAMVFIGGLALTFVRVQQLGERTLGRNESHG
jgi:hypothetical protein